jgi:hypothetical protein
LGKFWRALEWKMWLYFMTIWNILRPFGIFCGRLVKFAVILYIFPFWYVWTKKNLATLVSKTRISEKKFANKKVEILRKIFFPTAVEVSSLSALVVDSGCLRVYLRDQTDGRICCTTQHTKLGSILLFVRHVVRHLVSYNTLFTNISRIA